MDEHMMMMMPTEDSKDDTVDDTAPVASVESWDSLFLTRTLKENHDGRMNDLVMCPIRECCNLCATAGSNQVCIYDTSHRGNFLDLSHLYVCNDGGCISSGSTSLSFRNDDSDVTMSVSNDESDTPLVFHSVAWPHSIDMVRDLNERESRPLTCPDTLTVAAGDSFGRLHVISAEWSRCLQIIRVCESPLIQIEPISSTKVICLSKDYRLFQVDVITEPTSISSEPIRMDAESKAVKYLGRIPANTRFALNPNRDRLLVVCPSEKRVMEIQLSEMDQCCSALPTPLRSVEITVRTGTLDDSSSKQTKCRFDLKYLSNDRAMISVSGGQFHLLDLGSESVDCSFRIGVGKECDPPLFDVHCEDESIMVVSLGHRNSSLIYDWNRKKSIIELSHTKKKSGMNKAVFAYGSHPFRSVISICNGSIIWKWDEPALVKDFFHPCSFFDDCSVFSKYGQQLPIARVLSASMK